MIGRGLLLTAAVLLVLLLAAAAGLAAIAYLPALADYRQALAERLLERLLERPVAVAGPVTLRPGLITELGLQEVRLGDAGPAAWRGTLGVTELRFAFQLLPALGGRLVLERLAGSGLVVALDGAGDTAGRPFRPSTIVQPLARFLAAPPSDQLLLEDVRIDRPAGPDGWSSEVVLARAVAETDSAGAQSVSLEGSFNEQPFELRATFAPPVSEAGSAPQRRFAVEASLPGIEEVIEGAIDVDGEALAASVTVTVESLGDLLEALRLRRQLEGEGSLRLQLAGPVDALVAEAMRLEARLATGETLTLEGRIGNLAALSGVALDMAADLRDREGRGARPRDGFDIEVRGLRGRLSGSLAALTISDLEIQTNLASADLAEIGPVGVRRVTRDAEGRLGLEGLTIRNGDPAAPSLDLSGSVADLLGGRGISLSGRFDLDLVELATGRPAPTGLGRLAGSLGFADSDGVLRLRALDASLQGNGPLALRLTLPPEAEAGTGTSLELALDIPDLDALAAALDGEPIGGGSAALQGSLELADALRVSGRGHVGNSSIWLDLTQDVTDGRIIIDGALKSPRLLLADLPRMAGLAQLSGNGEAGGDDGDGDTQELPPIEVALDTEATIVDAAGAEQGRFNARLTLRDGSARLDPLHLDYLGGSATATLAVSLDQDPPRARLDAEVRALSTGTLLGELGIQPLLEGDLDATLALTGRGRDRAALTRSLDGVVTLAMGSGRIGTRLIDLTAQNLVSWLFSAGQETRLVCAAARLRLTKGIGNVEGLVLQTENVQLLGGGSINFGRETLDVAFEPRPTSGGPLQAATPFRVHGPFAALEVEMRSAAGLAGRAVVETLTLPFNVLGALFGGGRRSGGECILEP